MYAIDTNLLVYAHNTGSQFHTQARAFVADAMQQKHNICIPAQVLVEFINTITWSRLENHLTLAHARKIALRYVNTGITILNQKSTQLQTFLTLLDDVTSRKKVFDIALVATLKDHNISGLYTVNVTDFTQFSFLDVQNPLN